MLLKTLKGRNSILLVLIPFIIVLLSLKTFSHPESLTEGYKQMPLYELLLFITGGNAFVLNIIACAVLILMAYGMVRLNERFVFIRQRTDLPAFIFALISTGTIAINGMHPSLMSSFLMLFAIERVFTIYHGEAPLARSFDAGFLLGLASMFYLFSSIYLLWFWASLIVLGSFRGREILSGLIGFIVPVFLIGCWYFWNDNLGDLWEIIINLLKQDNNPFEFSVIQLSFWGILGVLIALSSLFMFKSYEEKKISSRKFFIILLNFFLFSVVGFFLFSRCGIEQYYVSIVPVTYIISHYFVLQKHTWFSEILFVIFVISGIIVHLFG